MRALLIGLIASMRSTLPIALLSHVARQRTPRGGPRPPLLARTAVANGSLVLAAAELLGDKLAIAPDRTILPGLLARAITGGVAAATLASPQRRWTAAMVGGTAAVAGAYATIEIRKKAMQRWGQVPTGLIEDAIAVAVALWILNSSAKRP